MSNNQNNITKNIGTTVSLLVLIVGVVGTYAVNNYRIDQNVKTIEALQVKRDIDHDLLIKIAADVQYLKERSGGK